WHNAGGAQSGYLVEGGGRLLLDCGPGVLARLRESDGWPKVDAIASRGAGPPAGVRRLAESGRDRDHTLPSRPLGRPRPVDVRRRVRPRTRCRAPGALAAARR